ncbi:MAG: hypothetical protein JNL57_03600 [Bacteroidetes bacterium]|nr:hypothetical protein [Bacteroidota bacterium]
MIICIAGPYSAETEEQRVKNLEVLNQAAAAVLSKGHTPVVGVNAALPVLEFYKGDRYEAIMRISMAVTGVCDAVLLLAESPGANKERDRIVSAGKPVFFSLDEITEQKDN